MSDSPSQPSQHKRAQNLTPALMLAILGGLFIGLFVLLKQLPTHHLSKSDVQRLLFYRYLREKGKLES
jgi:formate/nitrite transporter FocA (FNT family)